MEIINNTYLKFINFNELSLWDVKRYFNDFWLNNSEYVRLKDIFTIYQKNFNKKGIKEKWYWVMKKINFWWELFLRNEEEIKDLKWNLFEVPDNSIIYSKINLRHWCLYFHKKWEKFFWVSSEYPVFRFDEKKYNWEYLKMILRSNKVKNHLNSLTTWISKARIKVNEFLEIKIPLPSLEEQNRIVEEYNKKLEDSLNAEKKAWKLEKEIENYLMEKLGIENKIVKKEWWLKFIDYKNFNRWDSKWSSLIKSNFEIFKVWDLIENIWTWTTPPTSQKKYFEKWNINFYTPADLTNNIYLDNSERKVTELAINEKKARKFEKWTILFVWIWSTVWKVWIINNDYATSNQQITWLFFNQNKVNNLYAYYYFDWFINITTQERTVSTIPIVNQEKILNIPIPLPPLEIQEKIVKHIWNLKEEIKSLKKLSEDLRESAKVEFEREIFS